MKKKAHNIICLEAEWPVVAQANGGSNGGSSKGKDSLKKMPYTLLSKQITAYCNSWRSNQEIAESLGYDRVENTVH